jgi:beta-lysine 5,6-aminomutase alpha subunit
VLGEAIELLERIVNDTGSSGRRPAGGPLLNAIADGTFGIMKRPADRGKGLDGVAKQEAGYYNPAIEILSESAPERAA